MNAKIITVWGANGSGKTTLAVNLGIALAERNMMVGVISVSYTHLEIAYNIGKILLEKYSGKSLEYVKDNKTFYLTVDFHEETNTWLVYQTFKYNEEGGWIASGSGLYVPSIELNKNTGEVISINTYSSFLENIP